MNKKILETGFMEFASILTDSQISISQDELLKAAEETQIHTFGWPIGVVLHIEKHRPKPYLEGIKAEIFGTRNMFTQEETYDYWHLKRNGDYYIIGTLFEDTRSQKKLFLDTRIVRITETFLRTAALYEHLGIGFETTVNMRICHGGLKNRTLTTADPARATLEFYNYTCHENEAMTEFSKPLGNIKTDIHDLVYTAILDITMLFDFFKPSKELVSSLVDNFLSGRIG